MAKPRVLRVRPAGEDHAVVTVKGGNGHYMRTPCKECPWRVANVGSFPPEAFEHSAETAYDMAGSTFACHMKGRENPATCAGFLLSESASDNLAVRLGMSLGRYLDVVPDPEGDLFQTYRRMAVANGVDPASERLAPCMPEARGLLSSYGRSGPEIGG